MRHTAPQALQGSWKRDQRRARTQPACTSQLHHVRRFTHDPGALEKSEAHWATMFTV